MIRQMCPTSEIHKHKKGTMYNYNFTNKEYWLGGMYLAKQQELFILSVAVDIHWEGDSRRLL